MGPFRDHDTSPTGILIQQGFTQVLHFGFRPVGSPTGHFFQSNPVMDRQMKKTRSVHELRRGYLIVRIWRKKTRSGIRHTISIARLFRNGDTWKESTRFGRTDIPLLRLLLNEAHTWIYDLGSSPRNANWRGVPHSDSFEHFK